MKQKKIMTENLHGYKTENAALAGGASFTYVSHLMLTWTDLVSLIVSKPTGVSSEHNTFVNKTFLKPEEGIEPSGHELTRSVPHQASGWRGLYYIVGKREETLT
jgi:hypothetical protein